MRNQNQSGTNLRTKLTALTAISAAAAGICLAGNSQAAVLGQYRFMGSDPNGDLDVPSQTGLTYTTFGRTNVTQVNTNNVFNSNAWSTGGSIDTSEFISFTVTPVVGYRLNAQSITFTHARSTGGNGGPTAGEVLHSNNGFASAGGAFVPSTTTTWNFTDFSTTNATTFRFHGWGASNASGTLSFDDVSITGDVQARASLQTGITGTAAARVIVGASGVQHALSVENNNLSGGSVAAEGLDYLLALSGATGLTLVPPTNGTGLAGGSSASHTVSVDTSTTGTQGGSVDVSSTNAFRANGTNGASNVLLNLGSTDVVDHSNASFSGSSDVNTLLLDFGTVSLFSSQSMLFDLHNLVATAGYTAALDLDSVLESGDLFNVFSTNAAPFSNLAAGSSSGYSVAFDTSTAGTFIASYTFDLSDENIAGATGGQQLTLNVTGTVVPEPAGMAILGAVCCLTALRRRRDR